MPATEAQLKSIVTICLCVTLHHRWAMESLEDRLVGHDAQAVWTPEYTTRRELWGKTGRKVDPTGQRPDGRPIINLADVKRRVMRAA